MQSPKLKIDVPPREVVTRLHTAVLTPRSKGFILIRNYLLLTDAVFPHSRLAGLLLFIGYIPFHRLIAITRKRTISTFTSNSHITRGITTTFT